MITSSTEDAGAIKTTIAPRRSACSNASVSLPRASIQDTATPVPFLVLWALTLTFFWLPSGEGVALAPAVGQIFPMSLLGWQGLRTL